MSTNRNALRSHPIGRRGSELPSLSFFALPLQNLVERLVVTAENELITPTDLPPEFGMPEQNQAFEHAMGRQSLQEACDEFERMFLLKHLEKHHWNITELANAIGERRDTLSRKIKRYKLKSE